MKNIYYQQQQKENVIARFSTAALILGAILTRSAVGLTRTFLRECSGVLKSQKSSSATKSSAGETLKSVSIFVATASCRLNLLS